MHRAVLLQTLATNKKNKQLDDFIHVATGEFNKLLSERQGCDTFMQFHRKTLQLSKERTSFNVQVRCSLIREAWRKRTIKVNGLTVKFNIPRNCKTFRTKANFFVEFRMYARRRIAVPIKQNRNYQRFQALIYDGWTCKTFGLTKDMQAVAYLSKQKDVPARDNMLGVDVNAKYFTISVISPKGRVLYQTYLGKHIWVKRKRIMERRAKLQSFNARKKLAKLKRKETNFVKTNLGQTVREIIKIANKFNTEIAIENLKEFRPKGKRYNRIVMRIPFRLFRHILEQRCFDHNIRLNIVDSWHTSKWCSHCGALANGHSTNYSLFNCKNCGQTVNSDRKASLAISAKALLERNKHILEPDNASIQISKRKVDVTQLFRPNVVVD
jgi:IS605 OrfB family transposase